MRNEDRAPKKPKLRKFNSKDLTRLMCLALAGLMLFSVLTVVIAQVMK